MRVAHVIPPQWEGVLGQGSYRMTFVPWILQNPTKYIQELRVNRPYIILDHGLFEDDLSIPGPVAMTQAALLVDADEVVLPDVLGDPVKTASKAVEALRYLPSYPNLMFVPQARTMEGWKDCLEDFLNTNRRPVIGLSSLRRAEGLRAQIGTRILMMKYLHYRGLEMHILGLCSVKHFFEEELPFALQCGVRGVDTCAAFALGARGLRLDRGSPRLFLGNVEKYESLTEDTLLLIKENIQILENWVKGE